MQRNSYTKNNNPIIYIAATPIGNLKEINQRFIETVNEVDYILCEDTRVSSKLLNHLNITNKKLESYHQHNEFDKVNDMIRLVKEEKKILLLSDAGYPLLSDPGAILVQEAIKNDINIVVINGSNALLPALLTSGFPTLPFTFIGFLPPKSAQASKVLEQYQNYKHTLVMYESIHRLSKTLKLINDILGNVNISISREITKLNEEHIYGSVNELLNTELELKGELVLVIDNSTSMEIVEISDDFIIEQISLLLEEGISRKNAIKNVAKKYGIEKNKVYALVHK